MGGDVDWLVPQLRQLEHTRLEPLPLGACGAARERAGGAVHGTPSVLHACVSAECGHAAPPAQASVCARLRGCEPPPHDLVHVEPAHEEAHVPHSRFWLPLVGAAVWYWPQVQVRQLEYPRLLVPLPVAHAWDLYLKPVHEAVHVPHSRLWLPLVGVGV